MWHKLITVGPRYMYFRFVLLPVNLVCLVCDSIGPGLPDYVLLFLRTYNYKASFSLHK